MFTDYNFYTIIGPAIGLMVLFSIGYKFWGGKSKNEVDKAISTLQLNIIVIGILFILLWIMLPSTASLSNFGYPETIKDIQSNKQMLKYLQDYNNAIVRTTRVVHWFIFIFVWGFLSSIYAVIKAYNNSKDEEFFEDVKERFSS